MPIFDIFSARKCAAARSGQADVYQYESIPQTLRVQLQQIAMDALGPYSINTGYYSLSENNNDTWEFIQKTLCRERGVHQLAQRSANQFEDVMNFIGGADAADDFIDVAELILRVLDIMGPKWGPYQREQLGIKQAAADAIEEVNERFRRAGVGFQFESGIFIRVDTEFLHGEVVKPALTLLGHKGFEGPNEEFREAHRHYRAGEYSQAVTSANKAFESAMKAVCTVKGWSYPKGARASDLVKVLRSHDLWPDYLDKSFDQLLATLSSGLPQVRNDEAHGQGPVPKVTPRYIAGYALHLAAANIVFIGEAADVA